MLSPADRIVEATLKYTLRPKGGNREKVIACANLLIARGDYVVDSITTEYS